MIRRPEDPCQVASIVLICIACRWFGEQHVPSIHVSGIYEIQNNMSESHVILKKETEKKKSKLFIKMTNLLRCMLSSIRLSPSAPKHFKYKS